MSDDTNENSTAEHDQFKKKRSKLPLILCVILFLAATGGGFYATFSGMISIASLIGGDKAHGEDTLHMAAFSTSSYVPVGEIIIPLGPQAKAEFLMMTAEIEIAPSDAEAFHAMLPRIRDLFNTYLQAVEARDLEQPSATMLLRDQLLRRLRVISDPMAPRDLLFTSFILK